MNQAYDSAYPALNGEALELLARVKAEAGALRECAGLLPAEWADQFWHNWRTHPYLDCFMPRAERHL